MFIWGNSLIAKVNDGSFMFKIIISLKNVSESSDYHHRFYDNVIIKILQQKLIKMEWHPVWWKTHYRNKTTADYVFIGYHFLLLRKCFRQLLSKIAQISGLKYYVPFPRAHNCFDRIKDFRYLVICFRYLQILFI